MQGTILKVSYRSNLESSGYLSRAHKNVYHELKHGNNGKGWTVMKVTREGLNKKTSIKSRE